MFLTALDFVLGVYMWTEIFLQKCTSKQDIFLKKKHKISVFKDTRVRSLNINSKTENIVTPPIHMTDLR